MTSRGGRGQLSRGTPLDGDNDHENWPIEVVLERLGLRDPGHRHGAWVDVLCPFHDDRRRGNAGYNETLNTFKCHACGVGGNSVTLVMLVLDKTARDAVEWLGGGMTYVPLHEPAEDALARWRR